jgi:hypothetical protein
LDGRKALIVSGPTTAPTCPTQIDLYVTGGPRGEALFIQGCTENAAVPDVERLYRSIRFGPS